MLARIWSVAGPESSILPNSDLHAGIGRQPAGGALWSETVAGDNPTPDQSDVEENAHAVGVNFEDNEQLDFLEKIEKRDRDRFELDPRSKTNDDTI